MTQPNIVVFLLDDMQNYLQGYMPQMQKRIAANGVTFGEHYVSMPICQPSRATFFTGKYPHNHGVLSATNWTALDLTTSFPKRLQQAGYKTSFHGKYMNTYNVTDNGAAVPMGWDDWHAIAPQDYYNNGVTVDMNDNGVTRVRANSEADYYTTICTTNSVNFINATSGPFYLQMSHKAVHFTLVNPDSTISIDPNKAYSNTVSTSELAPRDPDWNVQIVNPAAYMNLAAMNSTVINSDDAFHRHRLEVLFGLDQSVKTIMDTLAAKGVLGNTYIIFTSDNGFMLGDHRDPNQKQVSYIPSSRVPLVISGPGIFAGGFCNNIVSQTDVVATMYEWAGITPTTTIDGISLTPLLTNPTSGVFARTGALIEFPESDAFSGSIPHPMFYSIVTKDYFYTQYPVEGDADLFDRKVDAWEMTNQVNNPAYSLVKSQLAAELNVLKTCSGSTCII